MPELAVHETGYFLAGWVRGAAPFSLNLLETRGEGARGKASPFALNGGRWRFNQERHVRTVENRTEGLVRGIVLVHCRNQ